MALNQDAAAALGEFGHNLAAHTIAVQLAPGDLLVFDNRKIVHGRTGFTSTAVVDRDLGRVAAGQAVYRGAASRGLNALATDGRTRGKADAAAVIMPVCGTKQKNGSR
jgi:hypothetical protein